MDNVIKSLLFGFITTTSFSAISQKSETPLENQANFSISFEKGECTVSPDLMPFQFAFLKVENKTDDELNLRFNIEVHFQEGCSGCNHSDESYYEIKLKPKEIYQSSCEVNDKSKIYLKNPNFSGAWNFEEIKLKNISQF